MPIDVRRCLLFLVALLFASAVPARQSGAPAQPGNSARYVDVVVTHKSGPPVSDLQQQDFTLLDNKVPQTITSFQAVDGRKAAIEVIVLIDAVNAPYEVISFEREQIDKFLRAEGGNLAHPTALAVLTDTGLQGQQGFSEDGNKLSASLDQYTVSLRDLNRSAGFWGAVERFQISLQGLHELVQRDGARPGRKIILCVSPGWPLLSGPEVQLDDKKRRQFFTDIVNLSTDLMRDRITLYSINPWGPGESIGREDYWENYVKGVSKVSQVNAGDLGVQVIATQSGGVAFSADNNVAASLRQALADTAAYYEISFNAPTSDNPDEYHRLEIRVAKPGLTARTRQGYYSGSDVKWGSVPTPAETGDRR
ncbi:MAG TPA: VWA domain-containing protein [Candidatus Acidoferrales bacterium]|nr:VWA domain-containing protein [Candidatus Acidoferrales bacterium]